MRWPKLPTWAEFKAAFTGKEPIDLMPDTQPAPAPATPADGGDPYGEAAGPKFRTDGSPADGTAGDEPPMAPPWSGYDAAPPYDSSASTPVPPLRTSPRWIYAAAAGVTLLCWIYFYENPTPATFLFAVLVPYAAVQVGLFMARGSLAEARKRALERAGLIEPIDEARLSKRSRQVLLKNNIVTEKVYHYSHVHPISLAPWLLGVLVLEALAVFVSRAAGTGAAAIIALAGLLVLSIRYVMWRRDEFLATDVRIVRVWGFFRTRISMMPVTRVTDLDVEESDVGKVLAFLRFVDLPYGKIRVESAGQKQALENLYKVPGVNYAGGIISTLANMSWQMMNQDPQQAS